jgi:penicillin V acylase-like amidase (Ntn superfamily)
MQKIKIIFVVVACMLALSPLSADACTAFRLKAKDGSILVGRSMAFAVDLRVGLQASVDKDSYENHNLLLYRQW